MTPRIKTFAAAVLAAAGAAYFYLPNPWWTTGRLIGELGSANEMHRLMSVGLVKDRAAGSAGITPALVLSLGDSWDEVRGAASAALCGIGAPAVPALTQALKNGEPNIREMASLTLECVKSEGGKRRDGLPEQATGGR